MENLLQENERQLLLGIARQAIDEAVCGRKVRKLDLTVLPTRLQQTEATFVTLTRRGLLRGCMGALEARVPLARDVQNHAVAAALEDPRFPQVQPAELAEIHIEISRLTAPEPLAYDSPDQLLRLLKPGVDGVILKSGHRRATFLPQVWEKIPQPEEFLEHLCLKLGTTADFWRLNNPEVYTYQVEEFQEQSLP